MDLTIEQLEAVKQGEPVHVMVPGAGEVVVVRVDVYEKMQARMEHDTFYTTSEMMDEIMSEDDADDPFLEELQKKYPAS